LIIFFVLVFGLGPTLALARDGCGPGASAGGGAASSGGSSGGGAGAAGGGDGGAGAGGGISSTTVSGAPREDVSVAIAGTNVNALGFRLVRYARQGTALLRSNQEWTHDVFTFCKPGDASLTVLRSDGSFSFDAVAARNLMRCMTEYGFKFDGVSGESTNFGTR